MPHTIRTGLDWIPPKFVFLLPGQYIPIPVKKKCLSFVVYTIGIILFLTQLLHTSHTLAHHSSVYMAHTPSALASIFLNLLISFASTLAIYSPGHIPEEFIFWNPSFYLILRWWCGGRRWGGNPIHLSILPLCLPQPSLPAHGDFSVLNPLLCTGLLPL